MSNDATPREVGSHAGLGLLPESPNQARVLTICAGNPDGDVEEELGHWYSPAAVREMLAAERERCARRVALHSQYPIETDYDRGYDKARKDAAETLRNMSAYELSQVAATPEQRALTGDVFDALDLRPEQFLTEGGLVNRGKLRAAFWYPQDYLPEGHWMRASDSLASAQAEIDRLRERVLELEADPKSGDVIPLAEPRCGDLRRAAERCITAWTVVRGGVWDPNGLMDEHMAALRKALGPNAKLRGQPERADE